jgi:hypothetical protein
VFHISRRRRVDSTRAAFLLELLHHPLADTLPTPTYEEATGRDGGAHVEIAGDRHLLGVTQRSSGLARIVLRQSHLFWSMPASPPMTEDG